MQRLGVALHFRTPKNGQRRPVVPHASIAAPERRDTFAIPGHGAHRVIDEQFDLGELLVAEPVRRPPLAVLELMEERQQQRRFRARYAGQRAVLYKDLTKACANVSAFGASSTLFSTLTIRDSGKGAVGIAMWEPVRPNAGFRRDAREGCFPASCHQLRHTRQSLGSRVVLPVLSLILYRLLRRSRIMDRKARRSRCWLNGCTRDQRVRLLTSPRPEGFAASYGRSNTPTPAAGETGIQGVTVNLYRGDDASPAFSRPLTDASGCTSASLGRGQHTLMCSSYCPLSNLSASGR